MVFSMRVAQTLASLDVAAINLTARDVRLGPDTLASDFLLAPGRFVSTNLSSGVSANVAPFVERGPFLIGGASSGSMPEASFGNIAKAADLLKQNGGDINAVAKAKTYAAQKKLTSGQLELDIDNLAFRGMQILVYLGEQKSY